MSQDLTDQSAGVVNLPRHNREENNMNYFNQHNISCFYWMPTKLGLKGCALMVYALIHSHTVVCGLGDFDGTAKDIAETLRYSKRSVSNELESLLKRGLLSKTTVFDDGTMHCFYRPTSIIPEVYDIPERAKRETLNTACPTKE